MDLKKSFSQTVSDTINSIIDSIWLEELRVFNVPIGPFIYPVIAAIILISGFVAKDPVWKTAIAAILFFIIPEIIGGGILSLIRRILRINNVSFPSFWRGAERRFQNLDSGQARMTKKSKDSTDPLLENWTVGVTAIFILFFLANFFSVESGPILIIFIFVSLITRFITTYFEHYRTSIVKEYDGQIKDKILIVLLSLILAAIGYTIWRSNSPYPFPLNWDIYEHQTLVNEIISGKRHILNSRISDSFIVDGYSPLFHILLSVPQTLLKVKILGFWWFVEFLQYFITILAAAFLVWQLTKDRLTAIIIAIVTAFIFESFIAYSPLFLIPQTFASVLVIFAFIRGLKRFEDDLSFFDPIQIILMIIILLSHYIVGLLGIVVLLTGFTAHQLRKQKLLGVKIIDAALVLSALVLILLPTATYYFDIELLNYAEAVHFNLDLPRKWELMRNWYGYSLLIFAPVGIFSILKSQKTAQKTALIIFFGTLSLVIAKIPYSLKFYALSGFFAHFLIAVGISALLKFIKLRPLRYLFLGILTVIFGLIFTLNQKYYKGILKYEEYTSHVSSNEIKAARWLKENYGNQKGIILISEPATQGIMEALSRINTQGGVYTNLTTRRVIDQTYPNSDSKQVANLLFAIQDTVEREKVNKILFVLSGRFFKWQGASIEEKEVIFFNIWNPADLSPLDRRYINTLRLNPQFKPVYQNPGLVVFKLVGSAE